MKRREIGTAVLLVIAVACGPAESASPPGPPAAPDPVTASVATYTEFTLAPDLGGLTEPQREVLALLVEAASAVNDIYWQQAFGDRAALLAQLATGEQLRFAEINYGPWDRLGDNAPLLPGYGPKPPGANFYPADVTRAEIETAGNPALSSQYTMVRRTDDGELQAIPYHEAFAPETEFIAAKLRAAAAIADNAALARYLGLRAEALLTDDYRVSDLAWMDMKDNTIELIVGPIETYEDQLLGAKAAHEALVLLKDQSWSARLARYADLLPSLQATLPVAPEYRAETPGGGRGTQRVRPSVRGRRRKRRIKVDRREPAER